MNRVFLLAAGLISFSIHATELVKLSVSGENTAEIGFEAESGTLPQPQWKVVENAIEISFPNVELATSVPKEVGSPHALIGRIALFESGAGGVKGRIVVNGTSDALAKRVRWEASKNRFVIDYPKTESATLNLLKQEQEPLNTASVPKKEEGRGMGYFVFAFVLVLIGAGSGAYFLVRFMKRGSRVVGSRKFLVEQMSYCPVGPKVGVSLLKVGTEFVLVGVGPGQVNFLSNMPKLDAQYQDENKLERESFKSAVEEEFQRLKGGRSSVPNRSA